MTRCMSCGQLAGYNHECEECTRLPRRAELHEDEFRMLKSAHAAGAMMYTRRYGWHASPEPEQCWPPTLVQNMLSDGLLEYSCGEVTVTYAGRQLLEGGER